MITQFSETTLIIGAGAHQPYGLPTARGLTKDIKDLFKVAPETVSISDTALQDLNGPARHKAQIAKMIKELNILDAAPPSAPNMTHEKHIFNLLNRFVRNFGESAVYSIDAFMARPNADQDPLFALDSDLGKFLIAYFIKHYEMNVPIGFHEPNWIETIINSFLLDRNNLEIFFNNPPSIVTFNYDNLFERVLNRFLVTYHHLSEELAIKYIQRLGILHVYGHIDSLNTPCEHQFPFFKNAITKINIIEEERKSAKLKETSKKIAGYISKSKDVYILGFGFDPINTDIIFGDRAHKETNFYTTNKGLTKVDIAKISNITSVKLKNIMESEVDCLNLITEKFPIFQNRATPRRRVQLPVAGPNDDGGWMGR